MTISDGEARRIASEWHGGQSSPLYALSSSGAIVAEVREEIEECRQAGTIESDAELPRLDAYVAEHGERGPVPGWSDVQFETTPTVADYLAGYVAAEDLPTDQLALVREIDG